MSHSSQNPKDCNSGLITIVFHGKSSHAASAPEDGRGAFDGLQLMLHALLFLQVEKSESLIESQIVSTGNKPANVIPDYSELAIRVQCKTDFGYSETIQRIIKIAEGCGKMTQTHAEVKVDNDLVD